MKAISIRQPWAWLIMHGGKDIENRDWATKFRGRVLVHAAKGCTVQEYLSARDFARGIRPGLRPDMAQFPTLPQLKRGGIVGSVEIADCVNASESPWFFGCHGFVLRDPQPLPFIPYKGQLGFFDVPDYLIAGAETLYKKADGLLTTNEKEPQENKR